MFEDTVSQSNCQRGMKARVENNSQLASISASSTDLNELKLHTLYSGNSEFLSRKNNSNLLVRLQSQMGAVTLLNFVISHSVTLFPSPISQCPHSYSVAVCAMAQWWCYAAVS